ncbi:hypothetical protein ES705_25915 [subsurface metagenome]
MRRIFYFIAISVCSILLSTSCTEESDSFLSDGLIIGQELQEVITENAIEKVIPFKWDILIGKDYYEWVYFLGNVYYSTQIGIQEWTFTDYESSDFEILQNIIRIEQYYFPLETLTYYYIDGSTLELYFKNLED